MNGQNHGFPGVVLGRTGAAPRLAVGFGGGGQATSDGQLIVDDSESHVGLFAPTSAGKGRNVLIPVLLSTSDSVIALDIKGELARRTARWRRDVLGQRVIRLDPWGWAGPAAESDTFNPLDVLNPASDEIADDAYAFMGLLAAGDGGNRMNEIYWEDCGQSINAGVMVHVKTSPDEADRSLRRVWQIMHQDDLIYGLAVLLDTVKDMHPYAYAQIATLLNLSADVTRSCIISTARQHIRLFGTELVQRAVGSTSFDLDLVRRGGPFTIYLVVPPDKLKSHAPLIRLWLTALMQLMTTRREAPERRTLLLLDEIAQLGRLDQVVQAITLMRGYGLRCVLALQSHAQLRERYGVGHEVLMENLGTIATFGHLSLAMSRQMADALGDISAEALFGMRPDEIAIRRAGVPTAIARRNDYLTDREFAGRFDPDPMHRGHGGPG